MSFGRKYLVVILKLLQNASFSLLLFSAAQAQPLDLTPDVAAPVSAPDNPNPPVANNKPNDAAIKTSVQSRLPAYADTVVIEVQNGIVFLTGFVKTDMAFETVVAYAFSAPEVIDVNANRLSVEYLKKVRSDLFMTARIKGRLMVADIIGKDMSNWPIDIETKSGQVYISGTVATSATRDNILEVIRGIKKIGSVHSQLKIRS